MATAGLNRAIPAYQTGPVDRLGRSQRKAEVPTLYDLAVVHRRSKPAPAPAGHLPKEMSKNGVSGGDRSRTDTALIIA